MDLTQIPSSDIGNFKEVTLAEHRSFLVNLVHYISLISLVHKTRDKDTITPVLDETLEQSRKDILKFYFSGDIYRDIVGEDHIIIFNLDRFSDQVYKDRICQWSEILMGAVQEFDLYGDPNSLKCGLTIPLELLKIVQKNQEIPMNELGLPDSFINLYVDKVYLKLKMNQRRKGSLIFH